MRTEKQKLLECLNRILLKGGLTDLQKEALSFAMKQVAMLRSEEEIRKEISIIRKHMNKTLNLNALGYFQAREKTLEWVLDDRRLKKESPTMEEK